MDTSAQIELVLLSLSLDRLRFLSLRGWAGLLDYDAWTFCKGRIHNALGKDILSA